jgi:hypothetical protein
VTVVDAEAGEVGILAKGMLDVIDVEEEGALVVRVGLGLRGYVAPEWMELEGPMPWFFVRLQWGRSECQFPSTISLAVRAWRSVPGPEEGVYRPQEAVDIAHKLHMLSRLLQCTKWLGDRSGV